MRKLALLAAIMVASCQQTKKEAMRCKVKEIKKISQSTLQDYEPEFLIVTDCGYASYTKKRGLHVGDTVTFYIPAK